MATERKESRVEASVSFVLAGICVLALGLFTDAKEASLAERARDTKRAAAIAALEARTMKAATPQQARELTEELLDSEALVSEARALGLDRGDHIVRRRLAQKRRALLRGPDVSASADAESAPTRVDLQSFRHVFFKRNAELEGRMKDALAALASGVAWSTLGEPFILGREFKERAPSDLLRTFGETFTAGLQRAALKTWTPLSSSFGEHLVYVDTRESSLRHRSALQRARRSAQQSAQSAEVALLKELRLETLITREPWSVEAP